MTDAPVTDEHDPEPTWDESPDQDGDEDVRLRPYGVGLVVLGALGLLAAFTLTVDRIKLLQDPSYTPSCNFNPVLSCGSVMVTDQASVLGFPNPLLGILGFSVVVTLGVLLAAGTRVPTWVLGGLATVSLVAWGFVHWLAFESLYRIDALCPWCLVVWAVTAPIALWSALVALRLAVGGRVVEAVWSVRYLVLLAWYLLVVVLILERFWDYWSTLL